MRCNINAIKVLIILIIFGLNLFSLQGQDDNSGRLSEITITSEEIWSFSGKEYKILKTTIYGKSIFAVHCFVDFKPGNDPESSSFAADVARCAYINGYLMNALKYNMVFSPVIEIADYYIGVSLVDEYDEVTRMEKGYGYVFKIKDIFDSIPIQKEIPGLKHYSKDFELDIKNKLIKIFSDGNYESIYDLYCENALKTIVNKEDEGVLNFYKKIDSIRDNENRKSVVIYIGNKGGRNGCLMYLPVLIRLKAYNSIEVEGNMILLLVDEAESVGVYMFSLNIMDEDDAKYFNF